MEPRLCAPHGAWRTWEHRLVVSFFLCYSILPERFCSWMKTAGQAYPNFLAGALHPRTEPLFALKNGGFPVSIELKRERRRMPGLVYVLKRAPFSARWLSERLGYNRKVLSKILNGGYSMPLDMLSFFCEDIGFTESELLSPPGEERILELVTILCEVLEVPAKDLPEPTVVEQTKPRWTVRVCLSCQRKYEVGSLNYCMECLV